MMKKILFAIILTSITMSSLAANVKVFNGRGLVGVFGNYTAKNKMVTYGNVGESYFYVTLTNVFNGSYNRCYQAALMQIDGIYGIPISNDLMLVPEFTFTDERRKGLIYPRPAPFDIVTGHFNGWGSGTNQFPWYRNCIFEPYQTTPETIIEHEVFLTGRLLVYGTGNQKSGTYYLKDNIGTSIKDWRNLNEGSWVKLVDKADPINVTVSGLTCSLQTPNKINFGIQDSNAAAGTLLASVQRPIAISCSQFKDQVDAYIGISANVKPEYYSGNNYDVNLINSSNRAAAYVKLFVHHNGAKLPIRLDQTMVELGRIKANENNVNITKTLEYELYSKGAGITGLARGSVEFSVIMR
ncbi:TPA: hypothetical protein ACHWKL_001252 [Providencia stuartii]|nr:MULTISPECIES: hypothetical protein [Providencia]MCB5218839.1 hypothetical protein [Providencia stuartii]MCL8327340.1 hypothetical protein [Providencia thailandensis]MDF4174327.1 hypothetical protein [Providencia thailandensis]MDN0011226.1 hypothetical protein [Providencia stuartii]MEB3134226.1 hypothetical protein [Providencia stuartii]